MFDHFSTLCNKGLNFSTPTVKDRELEILIIASIQTLKQGNKKCGEDEVSRLFRDSVDDVTKETFDRLLDLLIQNQSVRLNITGNREYLPLPKENQKLRENDENQEKPVLMEDIGNLRLQILEEFRNMKSSFLTEVKSFKKEFLQSYVKHSPSEKVHGNSTSEISEMFINYLEEEIWFLREQLRNKDKIINSIITQLSKNSEVIQTPIINQQDKNLFLKAAEENTIPVKQKISHNT